MCEFDKNPFSKPQYFGQNLVMYMILTYLWSFWSTAFSTKLAPSAKIVYFST